MSEEYEWTPFVDESRISWQDNWTPRDSMVKGYEDPILREFAEKCEYFTISKWLGIAMLIATIDGYLYVVVDWEQDNWAEHSTNSISFRIKLQSKLEREKGK